MSVVKGKVESKSKAGTGIKVGGDWYNGTGALLANVNWKDEVEIVVDGKNVVEVLEKSAAPAAAPRKAKGGGGGWDDPKKQGVIVYQSSRKDAIEVSIAMFNAGVLPLPAAKNAKFDGFMAFVDEQTDKYYNEAMEVFATGELPERIGGE